MEESKFQDYYSQIQRRDQQIEDETELPQEEGSSVWTILGLGFGISSMVACVFAKIDIMLALLALLLSIIGCIQHKTRTGVAAIICSLVGLALGIIVWKVIGPVTLESIGDLFADLL